MYTAMDPGSVHGDIDLQTLISFSFFFSYNIHTENSIIIISSIQIITYIK